MESILKFLTGKKTYLLLLAYIGLVLGAGVPDGESIVSNIDADKLQDALLAAAAMAAKAAFDRFSKK